jgi:IclR family pca regulon transcriptional regulator
MAADSQYRVASLAKGLNVLAVCAAEGRDLRIVDIATMTGFPTPTVFRLLRTLEAEGYVEQLDTGRFRPGPTALALGYQLTRSHGLVVVASEPLRRLAHATGSTVNLAVLTGVNVLYLIRIRGDDLLTANIEVGSQVPAVCTSLGKAVLAHLPPAELKKTLRSVRLDACQGPRAAQSFAELEADLASVRERGWALQDEQFAEGLRSIAAPIFDDKGILAAVNVVSQASRHTCDEMIARNLDPLLEVARGVSRRYGYIESTP